MNQTFSGVVLLSIVVLIAVALFAVAYFIKPNFNQPNFVTRNTQPKRGGKLIKNSHKKPARFKSKVGSFSKASDKQLYKLQKMIVQHFNEFSVNVRQHHLVLEKNATKVAMLTLDESIDIGRRRLGDVVVINFHNLPNVAELKIELKGLS